VVRQNAWDYFYFLIFAETCFVPYDMNIQALEIAQRLHTDEWIKKMEYYSQWSIIQL
jgi:hypothetical protein